MDGKGKLRCAERMPLFGRPLNPMRRALVDEPLDVGVRSINALFSVGRGARLGLFAGSGVGKSVLLGMMARYTSADVVVVGLVGERGREVKEFIERILGPDGLVKAVVIAAPADASALGRVHGAYRAMAIAEYFRDQGQHVLLLIEFIDAVCDGSARDRSGHRRDPGEPGLSPLGIPADRRIVRASRQWRRRHVAASPLFTPFWSKATISMIRSGIRPEQSSTVIWCCRAGSPMPVFFRQSMSVASVSRVMSSIVSSEQIALRATLQAAIEPPRGQPGHDRARRLSTRARR